MQTYWKMNNEITLKELTSVDEMLKTFDLLKILYPDFTIPRYKELLEEIILHNYKQLAAYHNDKIVGVSGFWIATKIWSGKYLEMDNVIIEREYRSKGIGDQFVKYLKQKAFEENCNMMACDVYTDNFKAHKFYMNQGFIPRGFHFINVLNEDLDFGVKD